MAVKVYQSISSISPPIEIQSLDRHTCCRVGVVFKLQLTLQSDILTMDEIGTSVSREMLNNGVALFEDRKICFFTVFENHKKIWPEESDPRPQYFFQRDHTYI